MRKKLGLQTAEADDGELIRSLLDWMHRSRADFTNTFLGLSSEDPLAGDRYRDPEFQAWFARWRQRLDRAGLPKSSALDVMRATNPVVIPRNHRVEEALASAERDGLTAVHQLLAALASPYEPRDGLAKYQEAPEDDANYRTFCGT
jgi:uncharacterized protein YdiU (UPF0061 family)